jgi:hypothetical protein
VALGPLRVLLGTQPLTLTQLGVCALVAVLPGIAIILARAKQRGGGGPESTADSGRMARPRRDLWP